MKNAKLFFPHFSLVLSLSIGSPLQTFQVGLSADLKIIVNCNGSQEVKWSTPDDKTRVKREQVIGKTDNYVNNSRGK